MATYNNQVLTIGAVPVGFDHNITNPNPLTLPAVAAFRVEGNPVRMLSDGNNPTTTIGLLAFVGDWVEVISEKDVQQFLIVCTDPTKTAHATVQFSDLEGEGEV